MSVLISDTPIQDDIRFKKTMQMFSNWGQSHYKFNAEHVTRVFQNFDQVGYTSEGHRKEIVLEVTLC